MRALVGVALVALAPLAGCASGGGAGTAGEIRFPTATFEEVVAGVAAAIGAIDAALIEVDNPTADRASITLLCDWRRPTPESPVLQVDVAVTDAGVRVLVTGEVLAGARRRLAEDPDSAAARAACTACPRPMREDEAFVHVSNARALRNVKSAVGIYLGALEASLAGLAAVRG